MYNIELQTIPFEFQNKNDKIDTSFVIPDLRTLGANKNWFQYYNFDIRGKLSI